MRSLDFCRALWLSEGPQIIRGVTSAFSFPQGMGKVLSACSAVEETTVFGGLLSHIRQGATSSNREVWRLRMSRGALPLPSFLSPNHTRFSMVRFFLSSRWTRFQYRFSSLFSFILCRAVVLGLFAAVLLFGCAPELVGGVE